MALTVVSLRQLKLEVLLEPGRTGDSVAEVCRRRGISRETFYLYRRRYEAEGMAGLDPRPRAPLRPRGRIEPELEAAICRLRSEHPKWGARRLKSELEHSGTAAPAISTIHQALRRNSLVTPQPPRRLRADRRFERPFANDLWQIDATRVLLRSREPAWILDCLDDHARYLLAAQACQSPSGEAAWTCFLHASARYGLPRQLLSDNASSFTGRLYGTTVLFERRLAGLGVELINSRPSHPQTLGKLERFHRTLKDWLRDEPPPADLAELQALLDRFRSHYNEERPHQGIGDRTPGERYRSPVEPALAELSGLDEGGERPYPEHAIVRKVKSTGVFSFRGLAISIGSRFAGASVRIVESGGLVRVYVGEELVRTLALDHTRRYQQLGRRRGGEVEIRA
jgi:transposase InsO family protein